MIHFVPERSYTMIWICAIIDTGDDIDTDDNIDIHIKATSTGIKNGWCKRNTKRINGSLNSTNISQK